MTTKEAADTLELYITTSDKRTLDAFDFAYRYAFAAVALAAHDLAKSRAEWHDDPTAEDHAEFHATWDEQFNEEARVAVVVALFERCERIRQEDLINTEDAEATWNAERDFYEREAEQQAEDESEMYD